MAFGLAVVPAVTMKIRLSKQGVGSKANQVLRPLTFAISRGAELVTMVATLCVHIIASSCGSSQFTEESDGQSRKLAYVCLHA